MLLTYSRYTSPREGKRQKAQVDSLKPYKPSGTDLEIEMVGYPTLTGAYFHNVKLFKNGVIMYFI